MRALQTPRIKAIRRLNCDAYPCQRRQRDEENIPMGLTFKIPREPRSTPHSLDDVTLSPVQICRIDYILYVLQWPLNATSLSLSPEQFHRSRERWELNVHYEKASRFARYEHDVYSRDGRSNWTNTWPSVGFRLAVSGKKVDDRLSIFSFPRLALEVSVTNKRRASPSIPTL